MAKKRASNKINVNVSEIRDWADKLRKLADREVDTFMEQSARLLAAEFIQRVIKRTPVGDYPAKIEFTTREGKQVSFDNPVAGKQGGHLRDSWKIGAINKIQNGYEIEIYNDASNGGESYASHIEFGHRIMNKKGGEVKGIKRGVYMMTNTEIELQLEAPELLDKKFEHFLRELNK